MEVLLYFRILKRRWWVILLAITLTLIPVTYLTLKQLPVYEAKATYVAKLSASNQSDERGLASALDILSRRVEIATTYAEVAKSRNVRLKAAELLNAPSGSLSGVSVGSRVIAGTNVIEITAQGSNPELVRDFANTIGEVTRSYVRNLYETYELEPLDGAVTPKTPIRPNKPINLALGGLLGLTNGIGLAFLWDYFRKSSEMEGFDIIDGETGAYNERYFRLRLRQELSRVQHYLSPFTVVLVDLNLHKELNKISSSTRREILRKAYNLIESQLREEDVVARSGEGLFALLLPSMTDVSARVIIDELRNKIALTTFENDKGKTFLTIAAGIAAYHHSTGEERMLDEAARALEEAVIGSDEKVCLYSDISNQESNKGFQLG